MKDFPKYLLSRVGLPESHTLRTYRAQGGYAAIEDVLKKPWTPEQVIGVMKDSGLRGRGGAGSPPA